MYLKVLGKHNYVIKKAFKEAYEKRKYIRKDESLERTEFREFLKLVYIYFYVWEGVF